MVENLLELGAPWALAAVLLYLHEKLRRTNDKLSKKTYALAEAVIKVATNSTSETTAFRREMELVREAVKDRR